MKNIILTLTVAALTSASAVAQDFSNVRSGLLLGVYANACHSGMRVTGTIPGYSAVGRLFPGDVLVRATTDGWNFHELRSHWAMENAKSAIGPHRPAALEIYRPGHGYIYAWVEFSPISAPATIYSTRSGAPAAPAAKGKAIFKMETEKGGARQMFQRSQPRGQQLAPPTTSVRPRQTGGTRSAAKLFGR